MKMVKGLLLGSAAGLVAITGAQAADLPMAEPVEYVKVCSTYGNGYFYIPGTQTCLRVSGFARFDIRVEDGDGYAPGATGLLGGTVGFGGTADDAVNFRARGRVTFDARSETEWGTLRSVVQFDNGGGGGQASSVRNAFIQFAGFTVGRVQSFYDYVPYNHFGDLASDYQVDTAAYTFGFGSGFSATVAIEDPRDRRQGGTAFDPVTGLAFFDDAPDDFDYPNLIGALRVDQAWGSAQLSAALQRNSQYTDFVGGSVRDREWGYAVQGGASLNLPWSEGSLIWANAGYTDGAVNYLGASVLGGNLEQFGFDVSDYVINGATGSIDNIKAWSIAGGFGYAFSPAVSVNVGANYLDLDVDGFEDGNVTTVLANVIWAPVQNLNIGVEGIYQDIDFAGFSDEDWGANIRIQRNF